MTRSLCKNIEIKGCDGDFTPPDPDMHGDYETYSVEQNHDTLYQLTILEKSLVFVKDDGQSYNACYQMK